MASAACLALTLAVARAAPADVAPSATEARPAGLPAVLDEITVTARKKSETVLSVPVSVTAFSAADLDKLNISSFTDYATKTPNLTFSYGTANYGYVDSHSVAIRGISGAGTTGIYIDDTPVPDSLDPRVVDIARIEVLKGPQGTLFGQSSLGGNLRLITVAPRPGVDDAHVGAKLGGTSGAGSPDYGADFAGSRTLIDDKLVARVVGFFNHDGGYLHRTAVDPTTGALLADVSNYGAEHAYGGTIAVRYIASDRLDVLFRLMAQETDEDGWSAPYAPLPGFRVQSLTMNRSNDVQEQARDRFYLPSLQLTFKGDGYSVTESLSYFDRRATEIEDGSEGTRYQLNGDWAQAPSASNPSLFPYAGVANLTDAWPWYGEISARRTTSETRLSFDRTSFGLSGVTGLYLSRSYSNTTLNSGQSSVIQSLGLNTDQGTTDSNAYFGGSAAPQSYCRTSVGDHSCSTYGSGLAWASSAPNYHKDYALFGELYYEVANFEFTGGGRYYSQTQNGSEFEAGALNFSELNFTLPQTKQTGFNPKLAVKYTFSPHAMAYASFSKGFRSGGAGVPLPIVTPASFLNAIGQKANTPTTYNSDFVKNYEIGSKLELAGGALVLTGALFQMDWTNIQQSIIAPVSQIALIANSGDARVRGGEFEAVWKPAGFLDLHAGIGYEDAVITHGVLYWQPTGSRVYNTPKITANASATFTVPVNAQLSSFLTLDASHVGDSVSGTAGCQLNPGPGQLPEYPNGTAFFPCPTLNANTTQGYAPVRAGYSILNTRFGFMWGTAELAFYASNLTNARPNLGDFNPSSYPKYDVPAPPGTGYLIPRVATLRPFNAGLQFRERF